jgi:hypothetical protein
MEELDRRSTASLGTSDGPENHESTAKSNGSIAKAKPFFELSDDEEPSPVRRETPGSPSRANKKKIREPYGLQLQSCASITPYGVEDILSAATKSPQNVTAAGSAISAIQAKNENRSSTRNEARPNTSPFVKAWDSFHLTPEISNPPDLKIEAQYQGKTDSEEKVSSFMFDVMALVFDLTSSYYSYSMKILRTIHLKHKNLSRKPNALQLCLHFLLEV